MYESILSPLTRQLIEAFQGIPGIGPKSAQRMVFNLLTEQGRVKGKALGNKLILATEQITQCLKCQLYTEYELCPICTNPKRDASLICIVESPADLLAIEQANVYNGMYFVLQGHLSPMDGVGPNEIGVPKLLNRIQDSEVTEIIMATNATMEGKATAYYILNLIDSNKITCSRIAQGVPLGGELEYLDDGTLRHAFSSRNVISEEIGE